MKCKAVLYKSLAGLLIIGSLLLSILCTRENKDIVGPGSEFPTINIIQPANDSVTVGDTINKYRIRGTINVAGGLSITAFSVNGTDYLDSVSTIPKEFDVTVSLTSDTNRFFISATDSKNKICVDTIMIYRKKAVIPANQAILSGTMYRPSTSSLAKRLAKSAMALNASGQSAAVNTVLPLGGADILIYNADSVTGSSVTSTKTDSTGAWNAIVKPGNYFIFSVWFDQQNLELITASIQNVKAENGKANATEDKVALADNIPPMVLTVLDAEAADDKNTFLASNLAKGLPIIITFSEPMNRMSVGDDTSGIVLGEIDPNDASGTLKNKIPLEKLWSATGKELRLVPKLPLTLGKYYKAIIPSNVKDLALNKIGSSYYGIFSVVAQTELLPFAIKGATVHNGDTIAPAKTIEISFTRPIDGVSLNKYATLSPSGNFFFEAKGNIARLSFPQGSGLNSSTAYTLQISHSAKDLLGDTLSESFTLSFSTAAALDTASNQESIKSKIILFVSNTMEAFIAQDLERFSQSFHPLLEAIDISTKDGQEQTSKQNLEAFMQARRNDAAIQKRMAFEGVLFPKIYRKVVSTDTLNFKKLIGKNTAGKVPAGQYCFIEDVGTGGFKQPMILDSTGADIRTSVSFDGDTLKVNDSYYIMNIPYNLAFFTSDANSRDPYYFGKLQNEKTNIEMQLVNIITKNSYTVRSVDTTLLTSSSRSADVLFDMVTTEQQSDQNTPLTRVIAVKMTIVNENNRMLVRSLVTKQLFDGTNDQFKQNQTTILSNQNVNIDSMKVTGTKGIELLLPSQKAIKVSVPVTFKWYKAAGVKAYIVGLSNEISGGASGLLVFTKDTSITIGANGDVTSGTVLVIDPSQIKVPLPHFTNRMTGFDSTKVYVWKVVGIGDSTASAIATKLDVIADSDFRPSGQPGYFTLSSAMPNLSDVINNQTSPANTAANDFLDTDKDGYADWIENALGTNKFDAASKPEMLIDSDKDGMADFFETMLNIESEDSTSRLTDANGNHVPDTLEKRAAWDSRLLKDSDKDSWPDEIEIALGTDPWNEKSYPQTYTRGATPSGRYIGKFFIQSDNKEYDIAIKIFVDSTDKAIAVIDSTNLQIFQVGKQADLKFEFGEWVFFYKITAGLNVNKFLKFRVISGYQEIEGNVDICDQLYGGGPLVGHFRARTDGNIGLLDGDDDKTNTPQQGMINQVPQDIANTFSNPPTDAKTALLQITKDGSTGKLTAKLSIAGMPELTSSEAIWQPQIFPMYILKFETDSGEIRVEGAIFKDTNAMYLGGTGFIRNKQAFMMALKDSLATIDNPVVGSWKGYAKNTTPSTTTINTEPLAYIGTRTILDSALILANKKAMKLNDSTTITVKEIWQEGVWKCKDSTGMVYQIIENPVDPKKVLMGKDKDGNIVIIIRFDGKTYSTNSEQKDPVAFKGDSTVIAKALVISEGKVKVPVPNTTVLKDIEVIINTLCKFKDPNKPMDIIYQIKGKADTTKCYIFTADPASGMLKVQDNKPIVFEMNSGSGTQPQSKLVPYSGKIDDIQTALAVSSYSVKVIGPDNSPSVDANVHIAALQSFTDPQKPEIKHYIITDVHDSMKTYIFLADSASGKLMLKDNKPVVSVLNAPTQPQSKLVPYSGDIDNIKTSLTASSYSVKVIGQDNTPSVDANVNIAALQSFTDPQKPEIKHYIISDVRDSMKTYVFLADSASGKLMLKDNKPVVSVLNAPTQPQSKLVPYSGDIDNIKTSLTASSYRVKVIGQDNSPSADANVNIATLQSFTDPQKPEIKHYIITDVHDSMKTYIFLADSASGKLMLKDNKPVVSVINTPTQPQSKLATFSGEISIIKSALTASSNVVKVLTMDNTSPLDAKVDITTLQSVVSQQNPGYNIYKVNDAENAMKAYLFLADSASGKLMLKDNKPLVSEISAPTQPQSKLVTYSGDINNIKTSLTASSNGVKVIAQDNSPSVDANVNAATLQPFTDPQKPGVTMYRITDSYDNMKTYLFIADSASGQLIMRDNKPCVLVMNVSQGSAMQPFRGTLMVVENVLASDNKVKLFNPDNNAFTMITINRETLQLIDDPKTSGQKLVVANRTDEPTKRIIFTCVPGDPTKVNIEKESNRLIVVNM